MRRRLILDTGLLKENAVQFYSSVLEAPSQEEVEGYIKYSTKKLNECGFTGVQSDDLASLPGKNWRRIMASYKALDARGELISAIMSSAFLSGRRMRRLLSRKDIVPGRGEITLLLDR